VAELAGGRAGELQDRVALVTGGAGGIGAATSRLLAEHGAHVHVVDIDRERATALQVELGDQGTAHVVDVRDNDAVTALADEVGRLDVLVNNVGHWVRIVDFAVSDDAHWDALHQANLLHVLRLTRAFLPAMIEAGSGSIVNVSSIEGVRGYPPDPVYAAYKAAVNHFTRSLAVQVGDRGVRVNAVAPDVTDSLQVPYDRIVPDDQRHLWRRWVPVGRMGTPEDQARVVLFLASDQSAFLTGAVLPTDGGTAAAGGWFRSDRSATGWTNRPIDP
jgi:NAD(P)-dependent dehydrogenase (short-subunit alcohol dehydrogenase family)